MTYILDYVRTGRGRASERGGLHHLSALDLVTTLQHSLVERNDLDAGRVEDVVLGVASQVGEQGAEMSQGSSWADLRRWGTCLGR